MSTYISPSFQGSDYVSGVPIDLVVQTASIKEQKYQYNKDILQQQINSFDPSQIQKESDRAYISNKLENTVNELNKFSGYDLSDSRTNGQLQNLVAGMKNDPQFYARINANKKYSSAVSELQRIRKDEPEKYNSTNEAYFQQKAQKWMNDPNQLDFNESYVPYYNPAEVLNPIGESMAKNPDILYMPDGSKRGEREVKQLTQAKVHQAFVNKIQNDPALARQLQIDYEVGKGNLSLQGTLADIKAQRDLYAEQIKAAESQLASASSSDADYTNFTAQGQELINNAKTALTGLDNKYKEVLESGDPSKYYNFNKYVSDYATTEAGQWAYRQEGKVDWDPYMLKQAELQNSLVLADFNLKGDLMKQANAAKIKSAEEAAKNGGGPEGYNMPNSFRDTYADIMENGEGTINNQMLQSILPNAGKIDDNGYIAFTPSKADDMFIDIAPSIQTMFNSAEGNKYNMDTKRASGLSKITQAYEKWGSNRSNQVLWEEGNAIPLFGPAHDDWRAKPLEEFLKTPEGQRISAEAKTELGFDINSPTDKEAVKKFQASTTGMEAQKLAGTMLQKNIISGTIKVTPASGKNAVSTSGGQLYVKMLAQVPASKLKASGMDYDELISQGLIIETGDTIKNANGEIEKVYQVPISVKSSKPLDQANQDYGMNHVFTSDASYVKVAEGWNKSFNDTRNDFVANPKGGEVNLANMAKINIDILLNEGKITPSQKMELYQDIDNNYQRSTSQSMSSRDRMNARKALNAATNLKSASVPEKAVSADIPLEGKALLDAIADAEGGKYNNMYKGETFSDFSKHPAKAIPITDGPNKGKTSSAAGRYQFIGSTWNKYKDALNLQDFSPASQDKAAWELAKDVYKDAGGGDLLKALQNGTFNPKLLGSTWEGLPGGGRPQRTEQKFKEYINNRLQNLS